MLTSPDHGYIGCLYLYPVGSRRPLTPDLLHHDVDISWWVTPTAYDAGIYTAVYDALQQWIGAELPFTDPLYSNAAPPEKQVGRR